MIEIKLPLDIRVQACVECDSITDGFKINAFKIWKPRKNSSGTVVLKAILRLMYFLISPRFKNIYWHNR